MITIEGNKILIDGQVSTSAEVVGNAILNYVRTNTDLIIFE